MTGAMDRRRMLRTFVAAALAVLLLGVGFMVGRFATFGEPPTEHDHPVVVEPNGDATTSTDLAPDIVLAHTGSGGYCGHATSVNWVTGLEQKFSAETTANGHVHRVMHRNVYNPFGTVTTGTHYC